MVSAGHERVFRLAEVDQPPVQREHRERVLALDGGVLGGVVGGERQPRFLCRCEAGVRRGVPLHRRALAVSADAEGAGGRVDDPIGRDLDVSHAQLIAVVEGRRAPEREEEHGGDAGLGGADAPGDAGIVVVAQHPIRPGALRQRPLVAVDELADALRPPLQEQQLEVERHVRAIVVLAVVFDQAPQRHVRLADDHAVVVAVEDAAHFAHHIVHLVLVAGVDGLQAPVRVLAFLPLWVLGVVAQLLVLDQVVEDVDAEAIDAPVEPEAQDAEHRLAHFGVAPVEVGLLPEEGVVIELVGVLIPLPADAAEVGEPVVGRRAVGLGISPDVPVALRVVAG